MRVTPYAALLLLACAAIILPEDRALAWNASPSQPTSAIFYPGEVQVEVEERLEPEPLPAGGSGFILALPANAQPDSFLISIDASPAGGYFWPDKDESDALLRSKIASMPGDAFLPESENSPERRALLEKYTALAEESARKEGELAATEARLELWRIAVSGNDASSELPPGQAERKKQLPADALRQLDADLAGRLPGLYRDRDRQQRALDDARQRLGKARGALQAFDRRQGGRIVIVPHADSASSSGRGAPRQLRYGYVLPAACSLSYRLAAQPGKESLTIAQDASLSQFSGVTWNAVETFISTVSRDRTLKPLPLASWLIGKRKTQPKPLSLAEKKIARSAPAKSAADARAPEEHEAVSLYEVEDAQTPGASAPRQEELATFRLWSLGKQRIEHETPVRLALATDSYAVRYCYTLRPISNPKGFLTAELALPSPIELPPGLAQFSVDGVAVGQQVFSFNGDRGRIFFGSDPQVTATVRDMQRSSGRQGFISQEHVFSWHWQVTLKSARATPVDVLLEDPAPDSPDASVTIAVESSPRPELVVNPPELGGAKIYRWKATLTPGEPLIIEHKVQAAAPVGDAQELDPGREQFSR